MPWFRCPLLFHFKNTPGKSRHAPHLSSDCPPAHPLRWTDSRNFHPAGPFCFKKKKKRTSSSPLGWYLCLRSVATVRKDPIFPWSVVESSRHRNFDTVDDVGRALIQEKKQLFGLFPNRNWITGWTTRKNTSGSMFLGLRILEAMPWCCNRVSKVCSKFISKRISFPTGF